VEFALHAPYKTIRQRRHMPLLLLPLLPLPMLPLLPPPLLLLLLLLLALAYAEFIPAPTSHTRRVQFPTGFSPHARTVMNFQLSVVSGQRKSYQVMFMCLCVRRRML
jgi:hypothetical protein